jgi:uncharacterized SAM-binding protein YcdF (DUF218 family)
MFLIDKLVTALISPLGTSLALGCVALICARRWPRVATLSGLIAAVWLGLWSMPPVSYAIRGAIEADWPYISPSQLPTTDAIVVLGGGIRPPETTGAPPDLGEAADRVWFASKVYHAGKAPLVVASGGHDAETTASSEAESMRLLLRDLGVPEGAIRLEDRSRNTRQNAEFTAALLLPEGARRILLVTSAYHMRRSAGLFERAGFEVIPAPTDHEARTKMEAQDWLPRADALEGSAKAIKELVGRWSGR